MTVADLDRLYDYSYWANAKLFRVLASLTPEQFTQNVAGSYGSIRNTLVHVLSAEWGWLERCGGARRGPALRSDDFPTVDSLVTAWTRVEREFRNFLAKLRDEDIGRTVEFSNNQGEARSGILGELLQHGVIHAAHHRGQVALLLRVLGHVPGNFDLLLYDAERRGKSAW